MNKVKLEKNTLSFPCDFNDYIKNAIVYDSSCSNNAKVYYFDTGYYLKIANKKCLLREYEATVWFNKNGLGPKVIKYLSLEQDYLLTEEVKGNDCTEYINNPKKLCQVLSSILRQLHSKKHDDFPLNDKTISYISLAEANYKKGLFDESYFLSRFPISSKEEAWNIIQQNKHRLKNDTLIHGDFCLPNIVLKDWRFSGLIDLDSAGVSDKHIDLYWAIWSLSFNLKTDAYTDYFLELYGKDNFEYDMIKVISAFEAFG